MSRIFKGVCFLTSYLEHTIVPFKTRAILSGLYQSRPSVQEPNKCFKVKCLAKIYTHQHHSEVHQAPVTVSLVKKIQTKPTIFWFWFGNTPNNHTNRLQSVEVIKYQDFQSSTPLSDKGSPMWGNSPNFSSNGGYALKSTG